MLFANLHTAVFHSKACSDHIKVPKYTQYMCNQSSLNHCMLKSHFLMPFLSSPLCAMICNDMLTEFSFVVELILQEE